MSEQSRAEPLVTRDALTAALLFLILAAIFALTRSRWLDDWDSVNFALALDRFDVPSHQPHPPGYPIYVAAGRLVHRFIADHAAALTLVSSLSGAAVGAMFYVLLRRQTDFAIALVATVAMALSPLYWLQSGLALTDMFAMVFVVAFMLVDGMPAKTPKAALARRIACGIIAGLSLGARPHVTVVIVAYWCFRAVASRELGGPQLLTALLALLAGAALWLIPAALATGGFEAYVSAAVAQFQYRLDKPAVSVLGAPISLSYLAARGAALVGWLGQSFAPVQITRWQVSLGAIVLVPYIVFAWMSPAKAVARPYILASGLYLLMLFILLPTQHQRYFLPFTLIVGWAVAGALVLFQRPPVRAAAAVALLALMAVPSLFLIGGLAKTPPPVAALQWLRSAHPHAILFAEGLSRHATFYWPEAEMRPTPKTTAACDAFRGELASGRAVLSTRGELCGVKGSKVAAFRRDRRVHDKHHQVTLFEFGAPASR